MNLNIKKMWLFQKMIYDSDFAAVVIHLSSQALVSISEISYNCAVLYLLSSTEGSAISEHNCFKLGKFNFL